MLLLTRKSGESIVIGRDGEIVVTVIAIMGQQVRLGVDAPKHIPVHRNEIYERVKREGNRSFADEE